MIIEIKRIIEKWNIWNKEEKTVKLEGEAKELVSSRLYKWIYIFRKKASERMPIRKM